jgi:hypothetical protein
MLSSHQTSAQLGSLSQYEDTWKSQKLVFYLCVSTPRFGKSRHTTPRVSMRTIALGNWLTAAVSVMALPNDPMLSSRSPSNF